MKAAQAIAEVLPPGKARIARLPAKDANAALMEGKVSELMAVYRAAPFRPDGIKSALDYRDVISVDETASSISWPFSALDQMLMGLRRRELLPLPPEADGKTTYQGTRLPLMMSGEKVDLICLEEAPKRTLLGLTGIHLDKNSVDRSQATDEEVLERSMTCLPMTASASSTILRHDKPGDNQPAHRVHGTEPRLHFHHPRSRHDAHRQHGR